MIRLLASFFTLCGLATVVMAMYWLATDRGVVRMPDPFYLALSLVGIAQTNCALWPALRGRSPNHVKTSQS